MEAVVASGIGLIVLMAVAMLKDFRAQIEHEKKVAGIKKTISGREIATRGKDIVLRQCARCGSSRVATYCGMCGSNLIANHTLGGSKVKGVGFDTFKAEGVGFQSVS